MSRTPKPSSLLSLTLLALTLVVLLCGGCIALIVSTHRQRGEVHENVAHLEDLGALRDQAETLNDLFVSRVVRADLRGPGRDGAISTARSTSG